MQDRRVRAGALTAAAANFYEGRLFSTLAVSADENGIGTSVRTVDRAKMTLQDALLEGPLPRRIPRDLRLIATLTAMASIGLLTSLTPFTARAADPASVASDPTDTSTHAPDPSSQLTQLTSPNSAGSTSPAFSASTPGASPSQINNTTVDLNSQTDIGSGPPLTGLFPKVGQTLLDNGIDFHGLAFDHFLANPTAGNITGQTFNLGAIIPELDLDLAKLANIPGGAIHVQLTIFNSRSNVPGIINDAGGFLTGFQTTPAPYSDPPIISRLTYEQKFFNQRLSIEVGRTNVYQYFLLPMGVDIFSDFSSTFNINGDFNAPPFPVWGGRVAYHLTPKWYVQAGAFEDNYINALDIPNYFGAANNSGVQILGELAYHSDFTDARYPASFEVGMEWNTRSGYSNIKGSPIIGTTRNEATDYPGGGVIFFEGQRVLWRGADNHYGLPANIAVYGSLDAAVDQPQPVDFDALIGANLTGLIPGRPFDALGVQVHYQLLSTTEADYETTVQNIFAGPGPSQSRSGYSFEIADRIVITPWLSLTPLAEYFVNPDDLFGPYQERRPSNGYMAGAFAVISFGKLFGTSHDPF